MPIPTTSADGGAPRQLARERVLIEIREAILRGVLQPGERLEEAALRAWLGVSATPIRQALHALALEGLVESAPQSHTIVASPRPDRIVENLQTVGMLLLGITNLALPEISDAERGELAALAGEVAEMLDAGRMGEMWETMGKIYVALIERCPNRVLVDLTRRVGTSIGYQVFTTRSALDDKTATVADAYRLLQSALQAHDADGVRAAVRRAFPIDRPA